MNIFLFNVSFYFKNQTYASTLRPQEESSWGVGMNMLEGLTIQFIEAPVTGASRIFTNGINIKFAYKPDLKKKHL
jgi:hypothetical protein